MSTSPSRLERFAPLAAGLMFAALSLVVRYLPMTDLPMHEAVVGLMRHYGDPSYEPPGLYVLNFGHPNQLFYVLAWALSYVVSTSKAVELVVAGAQILTFVGAARLADHLGRRRWGALLVTPLALGFTFYWGLVANLVGYAALLLLLPMIDRETETPSLRGVAKLVGVLVLLFFAHESILVMAAAIIAVFAVLQPLSRKTVLRLAPVVIAAAIAVGHQLWAARFFTKGQPNLPTTYLSLAEKVKFLPNVLFGSHEVPQQLLLLGISLIAVGFFIHARVREPGPAREPATGSRIERGRSFLWRYRFEVVALLHLAAYFAVPFTWHGATLIHERFLGPGWAIFVVASAPRMEVPRLGKLIASVLPLGVLLVSWPQFLDAHQTYSDLDAIIAKIPRGTTVTQLSIDRPAFRTRIYSASTGPARIAADRGGRVGFSLVFSPISPIMIPPPYRWDEYNVRIAYLGSKTLKPTFDLTRWEWLVVQSRDPSLRDILLRVLSPDAELVTVKGEWLLLHSTHPIIPILSPDAFPPPHAETAWARVQQYIDTKEEHGEEAPPGLRRELEAQ